MKEYLIIFQDGSSEKANFADKTALIDQMYDGNKEKFKKDVRRLIWSSLSMHFVEDVVEEKVNSEIISADVNPYGWRNS